MTKQQILLAFIEKQKQKIEELKISLHNTEQDAINSPGAMQSHSDTSKFQLSNLALGLKKRVAEAEETLILLDSISRISNNIVSVGSFFILEDTITKNRVNYLLIPQHGGEWVEVDGEEVLLISEEAPLISSIFNKKEGDRIMFREKVLKIVHLE